MENENKLLQIQSKLNAPKDLLNSFGGYNYRSCESILTALKPLLIEYKCLLTLSDKIISVHDRVYVEATATLLDIANKATYLGTGYAREEAIKKGMDSSQITGAASSYARKYALNGLFLIDDSKDSDHTNDGKESAKSEPKTDSHADPSKLKPSEKTIVGIVSDKKQSGIFSSYTINGIEVSTKQPKVIEDMDLYIEGKDRVSVIYYEQQNGKWTNRYIASVRPIGDSDHTPF